VLVSVSLPKDPPFKLPNPGSNDLERGFVCWRGGRTKGQEERWQK
jgi:hypothetical protein